VPYGQRSLLFPTVAFACFFVVAFVVNWLARPAYRPWLAVMTTLSLVFYGYSERVRPYVLLLVASAVVNWFLGGAIRGALAADGSKTPASIRLVRLAVVVDLAVLGFYKYYDFANDDLHLPLPELEIVLPIAISFFTFHAISYVIDIGRGEIEPMRLGEFTLYLSYFPHLVAGPIVRASEFGPQLRRRPDPSTLPFAEAIGLILAGLFKKVVVSSFLATELVDPVFGAPEAFSRLELLVGVYAYAVQIYADFSGYTDIAIGCALLLGIRFPQNFDHPYRALSLQDFWRRWHMTLSRWLRDYLYIPLGGNRGSRLLPSPERLAQATYLNLFLTMFIGGFWHGAAWTFLVWGAIHGAFLGVERFIRERWRADERAPLLPRPASAALQWLVTFHVVCLAWIFFRADELGTAWDVVTGIATNGGPAPLVTTLIVVLVAVSIASQFTPAGAGLQARRAFRSWSRAAQAAAIAGALTLIDVLGPDGVAPFIYFQF
jgi:alginate O-acetyltransferase complex protein AlgI